MFSYWYHRFMVWYYGRRIKKEIDFLRKLGENHPTLPSLKGYTDEQIVKGFLVYTSLKDKSKENRHESQDSCGDGRHKERPEEF